jgi:hypothetical protein
MIQRMPPVVTKATNYAATYNVNYLSAAGSAVFLAAGLSAICLKVSPGKFLTILGKTLRQLWIPALTFALVLALALLMNYSGATATLGLAFAATGSLFPVFSVLLGWVGVFLTGSDTSSNALFGNLQVITANTLNLNPTLMAAANSAGGVMGKMISLQSIAVAVAATGMKTTDEPPAVSQGNRSQPSVSFARCSVERDLFGAVENVIARWGRGERAIMLVGQKSRRADANSAMVNQGRAEIFALPAQSPIRRFAHSPFRSGLVPNQIRGYCEILLRPAFGVSFG